MRRKSGRLPTPRARSRDHGVSNRQSPSPAGSGVARSIRLGHLTHAATGEGIGNATVAIGGTGISTVTGDGGGYEIGNVPAGEHTVTASAEGFESLSAPVTIDRFEVTTRATGPWSRASVEWTVSHADGLRSRDGGDGPFVVRLTVMDSADNIAVDTRTIDL